MAVGTVKSFNATNGFGFIQSDAGGADAFVHISAVESPAARRRAERDRTHRITRLRKALPTFVDYSANRDGR